MRLGDEQVQDAVDLFEERIDGIGESRECFHVAALDLTASLKVIGTDKVGEPL